jgi:carboxyl-terminal processing protease
MTRPLRLLPFAAFAAVLLAGGGAHLVRASAEPEVLAYREKVPPQARQDEAGEYRLDRLYYLSKVIMAVKDQYVDPSRVEPREMVVAALEAVEKTVAEVMVQGDARSPKLVLTVGSASRDLDLSAVDSLWTTRIIMGEAMGFIQDHLVAHDDLRQIEYAAVNGMLSTLDPHTVLLEPKAFKDMKLSTRGEFGGIGFVIAMRDGNLTVVKVLKGTPAQRAGVKAKDVITKIEEQSTVEMDLNDAVDRLRGKPQTRVSITIQRVGAEPKRLSLVREIIKVETVPQAKLLDGNVGYIRLSQFSANSRDDVVRTVREERARAGGKLAGLVLDLRGNPGGLLEQAVQVSDLFLQSGVIVKTVGGGRTLEVKEAGSDADDLSTLPLVVLVNNGSASASEILAGALKNNGRALLVGRQTFGKGSVQVLQDFKEPGRSSEEVALKLTIAQYLTPGDVSIQEVGITPDVLLLPGRALKEQINFFAPPRSMGEIDLDRHLSNPGQRDEAEERAEARNKRVERAPLELRYLLDEKDDQVARALRRQASEDSADGHTELSPEQVEDEEADADPDQVKEDYQIRFARELILRAPFDDRARLLEAARALVAERHEEEERRLETRLKELGVDWNPGPATAAAPAGTPRAAITLSPPVSRDARAGDVYPWTVSVENRGDAPFRRLRAFTLAEKNPILDRREFVFGTIRPGERRSWVVPVRLPRGLDSRRDEVTLRFEDDAGQAPPDVDTSVGVVEVPGPKFAFSLQVDDSSGGNGDGLAQRGESFTLRVDVRNAGAGASGRKTFVAIRNLGDEKVFVKKGREILGALKPGESRAARLEIELRKGSRAETMPFRVSVVDEKSNEYVSDKIEWPVARDEPAHAPAGGAVRVEGGELLVRGGASVTAPAVATARKGAVLPVDARYGSLYRVQWQKGRFGFVPASEVKVVRAARAGTVVAAWQREPPRIALSPDPVRGSPVVDVDTFRLSGSAVVAPSADPSSRLRDVFVFVNDQKVFFRVVPEEAGAQRLEFQTDLPLKPGQNLVTVVAREDEEFQSRRSVVIFRRPPAAVAQDASGQAPKARPQ